MGIEAILDASRAGLQNERLRMETASERIATANQPVDPARLGGKAGTDFANVLGAKDTAPDAAPAATRKVYAPKDPMADKAGYVHYPDVDMVTEMTGLMTASRAYEANVRSFNVLRGMVLRALDIGAK
ncbi:MAG TPA: flagellar basal body rod C-terminal domain-containing protein [Stenotrophomonas sp.]|nr:flagellar basal body rod C-terminal domain-containing protein [Stenotrophomonas sp.]